MSARTIVSRGQLGWAAVALAVAGLAGWHWGFTTVVLVNAALTVAIATATVWRLAAGVLSLADTPDRPALPATTALPTYSVLVPMYHEAAAVGGLVAHLLRLNYPVERLQILLLTEADDAETIAAARLAADGHAHISVVVVPPGTPRTKPRACNHGLGLATGELLVVFDAEDRPELDQLRHAVAVFAAGGPELGCVQAGLDCYNARDTWLTRLFAAEYAAWFAGYLPGLVRLRAPVPLGGTSNHLRCASLRQLAGWDAWNVAEDCDLGLRLAQAGLRTEVIASTTWEEATDRPATWLRQRSRWCKGWTQTWLVHARQPVAVLRRMGWLKAVQMHVLLASTVLGQLLTPPCWLLLALWLLGWGDWMRGLFPPTVTAVAVAVLVLGNALNVLQAMASCLRRGHGHLVPWCLLLPIAWLLAGIAAWRGVLQLISKPFHWEKTAHAAGPQNAMESVPKAKLARAEPTALTAEAGNKVISPIKPVRHWNWWWLAVAPLVGLTLVLAGHGDPVAMRLGTLHDLAGDLDLGRQALLASPWLLPLPTLLMAPFAWLPREWPWIVMNTILLLAATPALASLLGSRIAASALILLAIIVLAPTALADLLAMLAFALLALAAHWQSDPVRRILAAPAWAAAAACHPLGLILALIALAVSNWRWIHGSALLYAVLLWLGAHHLVFGDLRSRAGWCWPPPHGDAIQAKAELAQLLDGPLAGRAAIVSGPAGHLVADLLRSHDGLHRIDLYPGFRPAWERRAAVLLLPTATNPLRPWSDRVDGAALGATFERATPMWLVWSWGRPP